MTFCDNCGLLLPAGADCCPRCGAPAPAPFAGAPEAETGAAVPGPHYQGTQAPDANTLTTGGYFFYLCLFGIPVAGFIIALVFAFRRGGNRACKRLARAVVLYILLLVGMLAVLYVIAGVAALLAAQPMRAGPWV